MPNQNDGEEEVCTVRNLRSELENLRQWFQLEVCTVRILRSELENLREWCDPASNKPVVFYATTAYILLWITTVIVCTFSDKINEIRHLARQAEDMLMRTEDMVKQINSKLPYGCGTDGMITSLYEECTNA